MQLGEELYIALYSKGHSVIEIQRGLNEENIGISHQASQKKLIRSYWMGTLSLVRQLYEDMKAYIEETLRIDNKVTFTRLMSL